jgi:acetyl-CoA acetyltransferase family protein
MTQREDIVILDGARTPIGSFLGGLSQVSATELGTAAAKAAIERSRIDPSAIDGVVFGNVLQTSKDAVYLARHVGLNAGAPIETPALLVNRACGSGIEAVIQGARLLGFGEAQTVLAGGAENMSMSPYAMRGVRTGWKMIKSEVDDTLFSALHDPKAGCAIGETVEHLAAARGISRQAADEAAMRGQERAAVAREKGVYAEEIVPVEIPTRRGTKRVEADESPRPETTPQMLAALPGLFRSDGVVTAGNSCGLNDAAAAVVMTTAAHAAEQNLEPLGRVLSWASVGVEPKLMGLGPVQACRHALERAGLELDDIDLIELNDSFTVQYLAIRDELGLNDERVNVNGGAIALGHPMGATGTRLILSALYELRRRGGRYALCTVCVGGGQGTALVVGTRTAGSSR